MDWTLIALGAAGGLIPDILRLVRGRYGAAPAYLSSPFFYCSLALLAGLGCLAALLGHATNAKEALAYGFGAPEVISRILASPQDRDESLIATIREWWTK